MLLACALLVATAAGGSSAASPDDGPVTAEEMREFTRALFEDREACTAAVLDASSRIVDGVERISVEEGVALLVDKSTGRLWIYRDGVHSEAFVVGVGRPGDKAREGDGKTPVGLFRGKLITTSSFGEGQAVLLDYPQPEDADEGLDDGRIGPRDRDRIVGAAGAGRFPPMNTPLGGWIEIHASGDEAWIRTTGCVTLVTPEMVRLFELIRGETGERRQIRVGVVACSEAHSEAEAETETETETETESETETETEIYSGGRPTPSRK